MKTRLLILLCLFCAQCLFAQKSKKYFDSNNKQVSEKKYKKLKREGLSFPIKVEYEDQVNYHLEPREVKGQLSPAVLSTLRSIIPALDPKVNVDKLMVVMYYPGPDDCSANGIASGRFQQYHTDLRSVLQITNGNEPVFVYKTQEGIAAFAEQLKFFPDPNQFFQKAFFKNDYPCNSFVVIDSEGSFMAYKGEHSSEDILKICKKMRR